MSCLEIGDKLLYDGLPSDKAVDKDIRRLEIMWCNILLYEGLAAGDRRAMPALARDGCTVVVHGQGV